MQFFPIQPFDSDGHCTETINSNVDCLPFKKLFEHTLEKVREGAKLLYNGARWNLPSLDFQKVLKYSK